MTGNHVKKMNNAKVIVAKLNCILIIKVWIKKFVIQVTSVKEIK